MNLFEQLLKRRVVRRIAVVSAWLGVVGGCASSSTNQSRAAPLNPGTHLEVDHTNVAKNQVCVEFCERLASCWYAVPGGDQTLGKEDVLSQCEKEEVGCTQPTTDRHCCGLVADCHEFASCKADSHGFASDCQVAKASLEDQSPSFMPASR